MKAYLTSIGETTEQVCKSQLEKFGFEVILLNKKEPWIDKYKKFLEIANEDCIRIDADIIPNKHLLKLANCKQFIAKAHLYDIYRNEIWPLAPIYYSKLALMELKDTKIADEKRPETSMWRSFPVKLTTVLSDVVGFHGFFQSQKDIDRVVHNKNGLDNLELDLVRKLYYEKNINC